MVTADVLILGLGGVGSAALSAAARRGLTAVGIDRFEPPHDRGSSHGQTRIIRQAYFEHSDYVPLVLRAFDLWGQLEQRTGRKLYHELGLLQVGPGDGAVLQGVRTSAALHGLAIESLDAGEVAGRFPGLRVPAGLEAVYETRAGALRVEQCIDAFLADARQAGATIRPNEEVVSRRPTSAGVEVRTSRETYSAPRAIVTAGPWASTLLADLKLPLVVRRKAQFWFAPLDGSYGPEAHCPAFLYELPEGVFYGISALDERGVKVAEHTGGAVVADPATVNRDLDAHDEERITRFTAECLPRLSKRRAAHSVCMYTMSPDEHFIVDRHPRHRHIAFAAGLSGHGFKFTSVLGELLVELTVDGRPSLPIDFLSLNRPALGAAI